jgi:phospholipid/cholesterol/gamma-HCH transport system substrate-binding protein
MMKPESRALARSFKVGIGGILLIAFLTYLTFAAQYGNPFSSKNYITDVFQDTHSLQVKDPVRQFSKGIGRISDIRYENGAAVVTLQIELGGNYHVYRDATAYIGDTSAVGSKFVGLNPGTPEAGPLPGDTIPVSRTKSSRDLYQVLNIFDPKTRTETQSFVRQFGGGLTGQADGFTDFVHNAPDTLNGLGRMSDALASPQANLPALLRVADQLSDRFRGREAQIAGLINQTGITFDSLNPDNGKPLTAILHKAPATLDQLKLATDSLNSPLGETQNAMTTFEPGAKDLGDSNNDLRGTFRDSVPVFDDVPSVAKQTSPAFDDLTPTFHDTRPLAPRLTDFFNRFATPLNTLAPYSNEIGYLFVRGNSFVSQGTAPGVHYAYFNADVTPYTGTGGFVKACHFATNPYPKPGRADFDHTNLGLRPVMPCGLSLAGLGSK